MDSEAVRQRINQLKDRDAVVRQRAAEALGAGGAEAVPALVAALRDVSCGVRRRAAESLGKLGGLASPAVPGLTEALRDRIHTVRDAARLALTQINEAG
jgi:HEAT repeat protein